MKDYGIFTEGKKYNVYHIAFSKKSLYGQKNSRQSIIKVAKKTNKRKQENKAGLDEDKWQLTMSKVCNLPWGRYFCPEIEWSV